MSFMFEISFRNSTDCEVMASQLFTVGEFKYQVRKERDPPSYHISLAILTSAVSVIAAIICKSLSFFFIFKMWPSTTEHMNSSQKYERDWRYRILILRFLAIFNYSFICSHIFGESV